MPVHVAQPIALDQFGFSVHSAGDFNHDGSINSQGTNKLAVSPLPPAAAGVTASHAGSRTVTLQPAGTSCCTRPRTAACGC